VSQRPFPLPMSIFDNIAYGPRIHGENDKQKLAQIVEQQLKSVSLWEEVKDRLNTPASKLSIGQQQRLCLARGLAVEPLFILGDEPTSALDPEMVKEVLDVMKGLAEIGMTMVIVTHEMGFAREVANRILFLEGGRLAEDAPPDVFFTNPRSERACQFLEKVL